MEGPRDSTSPRARPASVAPCIFSAEAVVLVPALALGYALVARAERPGRLRIVAAAAALALIFAAFFTELQPLALHTFLWAHLLQNVVLAEWAPGLLVLAVPPVLGRRAAARAGSSGRSSRCRCGSSTYFVWHLPWIYDYALEHPHSLLHVEHLSYLVAGIALWWPVVHGRASSGGKALYLFAAFVLASPIGLLLALVPRPVYSFYENAPRTWGPAPLFDQQIAGMTMAFEQAAVFFAVFTMYLFRFLREESRRPAARSTSCASLHVADHGSVAERGDQRAVRRARRRLRREVEDGARAAGVVGDELDAAVLLDPRRHVADERRVVEAPDAPLGERERLRGCAL